MNHYLCLNLSNGLNLISLFRNLKIEITPELYLSSIRDRKFISVIAKFRCSSPGLAIETGIHCQNVIPKEEMIWLDCSKFQNKYVIECEFHFLMRCLAYNELRNKYLSTFYRSFK